MLRRALVVLSTVVGLVAVTAMPANAAPLARNAFTGFPPITSVTVCVDVSGSNRAAYVQGTSAVPNTTLTVWQSELYQCNTTTCGVASSDGYSQQTAPGPVTFVGTPFTVQFGHTYYACADVSVSSSITGLTYNFGWVCSNEYAN